MPVQSQGGHRADGPERAAGPGLVAGLDEAAGPDGAAGPAAGAGAGTAPAPAGGGPGPAAGAEGAAALDPSGELRALAGDCVHCGFCLPACPTYQLWGEEMDSPRGRIHLMTQILEGAQADEAAAVHFDRCLGCMACVPACPSGVRYDRLIEAARTWAEEPPAGTRPVPARSLRTRAARAAIFETFPYPRRLRALTAPLRAAQRAGLDRSGLAGRLSPELAAALRVAPRPRRRPVGHSAAGSGAGNAARSTPGRRWSRRPARSDEAALPELMLAEGPRRAMVGMLTGCVQQVFFPEVNAATARVLAAEGCDVVIPRRQGCCGALSLHAGRRAEAARFARRTIAEFERAGVDAVVVNAAGCGSAMKEYEELLAGDGEWAARAAALSARVRDFTEFLAELGPVARRHPLPVTVAYHDACHLAHAQRITRQPRDLLAAIPRLRVAEIAEGSTCCGSAGIYNLVQPEAAGELGERKAATVRATGADLLVSGNSGCALQISSALAAQGIEMPMAHIAVVLDASLQGTEVAALLA
jgi:glycolate oxidase iron-sulfur subunit